MVEAGLAAEGLELLDGGLYEVSPRGPLHETLAGNIQDRLVAALPPGWYVRKEAAVAGDPFSLPEPDVSLVRGARRDHLRRHPTGGEMALVVEVAVTSVQEDRTKLPIYARAGVPCVWILDVPGRRLEVHEAPEPDGEFRFKRILHEGERVTVPVLEEEWTVEELLG